MKDKGMSITESEWKVLKVLWDESPQTLPQIVEKLAHMHWSVNTIQTFLSRLVKKSALATTKQGKGFLYAPLVKEQECQLAQARRFLDRVYDGSLSSMVMGVLKSGSLSEDEFAQLKKLVEEYERSGR